MERMQCQEKATNSVQELVRTPINRPKHMFTQDGMPWVIPTWCTRENPVLGKQLFFFPRLFLPVFLRSGDAPCLFEVKIIVLDLSGRNLLSQTNEACRH
jgi:hypothetical protein